VFFVVMIILMVELILWKYAASSRENRGYKAERRL
jgi:hypothetical protein